MRSVRRGLICLAEWADAPRALREMLRNQDVFADSML
jgi:hypothetical protein